MENLPLFDTNTIAPLSTLEFSRSFLEDLLFLFFRWYVIGKLVSSSKLRDKLGGGELAQRNSLLLALRRFVAPLESSRPAF